MRTKKEIMKQLDSSSRGTTDMLILAELLLDIRKIVARQQTYTGSKTWLAELNKIGYDED